MKKSTIAALLSALVFPGLGHLYLRKYIPGTVLLGVSLASIYYIFTRTLNSALQIVEEMQSGSVSSDGASLVALVSKQSSGGDAYLLNAATIVFLVCWLIGIFDSVRIGRIREKNDAVPVDR